jgi:DNA-binding transcriptional LysR family regulator
VFTLVQLRCFVAVAEDLNLRRAAKRLNMTQPPLTRHIQALEHQVGTMLLDRSGRALRLTPAGQSLERSARRILDGAAEATRDAQKIARGDSGSLTLAFTAASSYAFLPRLVTLLRERLPALTLTLRELATPEQIEALKARQLDLCLLRPPGSIPGIQTMRVYRESLVLAVPTGHALAARPNASLGDLSGETLITYPPVEGPYFHHLIMGLLHVAGVIPAGVQYITQTHSILALVGAGLGVAIVPKSVERLLPVGVTLRALGGAEGVSAELVLAWPAQLENPACATALELIVQFYSQK